VSNGAVAAIDASPPGIRNVQAESKRQ